MFQSQFHTNFNFNNNNNNKKTNKLARCICFILFVVDACSLFGFVLAKITPNNNN